MCHHRRSDGMLQCNAMLKNRNSCFCSTGSFLNSNCSSDYQQIFWPIYLVVSSIAEKAIFSVIFLNSFSSDNKAGICFEAEEAS
jgi:hypothetical protein